MSNIDKLRDALVTVSDVAEKLVEERNVERQRADNAIKSLGVLGPRDHEAEETLKAEIKRLNDIITHKNQDFAAIHRQSDDWERQAHATQNELDGFAAALRESHHAVLGYSPGAGESAKTIRDRIIDRVKQLKEEMVAPLPAPDFRCGKGGGKRIKGVVVEFNVNLDYEWKYRVQTGQIDAACTVRDLYSGMKYRCLLKTMEEAERAHEALRAASKVWVECEA